MVETRWIGDELEISVLGLGCNNFGTRIDQVTATEVVDAAFEHGINFFDTANSYGAGASETYLGRALQGRRDHAVIATKFGIKGAPEGAGASGEIVRRSCEASLSRLGTDYIDLYYVHVPDPDTRVEETLGTLDELVREGKVRHIACSNFSGPQLVEAVTTASECGFARFEVVQAEWSLLERGIERDVVPAAQHSGLGVVPYFPLASGVLTGKYRAGEPVPADSRAANWSYFADIATEQRLHRVARLRRVAERLGHSLLELALGWVASHQCVTSVLAGATGPEQVAANAEAVSWRLGPEEMAAVDAVS